MCCIKQKKEFLIKWTKNVTNFNVSNNKFAISNFTKCNQRLKANLVITSDYR